MFKIVKETVFIYLNQIHINTSLTFISAEGFKLELIQNMFLKQIWGNNFQETWMFKVPQNMFFTTTD